MWINKICLTMILMISLVSNYSETGETINIDNIEENTNIIQTIINNEIENVENNVDNTKEENIEENVKENVEENVEENIEEHIDEKIEENLDENIEIIKFNANGLILNNGVASEEISRLRSFFRIKGYEISDGYIYDQELKNIVMDYQSKNQLKADGIIGPLTYEKINEDMELNKISIPKWKLDENLLLPQELILINKSSNTLYHIKDKQIVDRYPVATGKSVENTPEGKFTIVNKYINPYWGGAGRNTPVKGGAPNNPLGKRWMGLSIKGGGTYGIHGNANEKSIGTYASLGCIRMHNKDIEYLFDIISIGTEVWIGTEERLNSFLNKIDL